MFVSTTTKQTAIMNSVTTTKEFKGQYCIKVITPKGVTYNFTLRNESKSELASSYSVWNLTTFDDVHMDSLAWWTTKKECLRAIANNVDIDFAAERFAREY